MSGSRVETRRFQAMSHLGFNLYSPTKRQRPLHEETKLALVASELAAEGLQPRCSAAGCI
jgi:hypothetical protein